MKPNYKKTYLACYLGFITQAIAANFAPLLFLTFHSSYGIPMGQIALISTVFFFTQLIVDIICSKLADQIGYRICVVASEVTSALGLIGLAILPDILPTPFMGILVSAVIYAIGSGLIEVLCSPIVEACPSEHKEAAMSLLHSFYCWGSVAVILLSTLFFSTIGIEHWRILSCLWAIVPIYNIYNFATCPIESLTDEGESMSVGQLFRKPIFLIAIVLMICSGSSELSMSQWASAFAESALGLEKTMGDLLGPCLFAVSMGICRTFYGKFGDKINLERFMLGSGLLCILCYLVASLCSIPMLGLFGCIICGFSVGIMWPGTISMTSKFLPHGGTAMFALLAMAGDIGGSVGPMLVGNVAQSFGDNLKLGLFTGTVFPVILVIAILVTMAISKKKMTK